MIQFLEKVLSYSNPKIDEKKLGEKKTSLGDLRN